MAFSPNGVCMPSTPEPEAPAPAPEPEKHGPHEEMDPAGGLLKFFTHPEVGPVERCLQDPMLRQHVTDANFCKRLRDIRSKALVAKTPEEISALTRTMLNDPRLTQCSMAGAGMTLTVEESDLQKAERLGDIAKRSPLLLEDMVAAEKCEDREAAKAAGNDKFAAKDYAGALAYWTRSLRFNRDQGIVEDVDFSGAIYCNMAMALLKLNFATRAEQAASRAIKHCDFAYARMLEARDEMRKAVENGDLEAVDETHPMLRLKLLDGATRRKALYRRALARELLHQHAKAYADIKDARRRADDDDAPLAEKQTLRRELLRFDKLKKFEEKELKERAKRKAEEASIAAKRAGGEKLGDAKPKPKGGPATPGASVGYLEEKDHSRWAMTRAAQLLEDVEVDLGRGASVRVGEALKQQCSVSASVTVKKGRRALYYDIDVHATWIAEPPQDFDLSPDDSVKARDRPRSLEGTVRLYNVSHETKYAPGADTNVAYMYQLGYKGIDPKWFDGNQATADAPPWAALLINGAHELYEATAKAVDALIGELKQK